MFDNTNQNKELANQLHDMLDDAIRQTLKHDGVRICLKELSRVRSTLNFMSDLSYSSYREQFFLKRLQDSAFDVMQTLRNIIREVDRLGESIEIEMHGMQNYSEDEIDKLNQYAYKLELKNTLLQMLEVILLARPALNNRDTSHIIYLHKPIPFKK